MSRWSNPSFLLAVAPSRDLDTVCYWPSSVYIHYHSLSSGHASLICFWRHIMQCETNHDVVTSRELPIIIEKYRASPASLPGYCRQDLNDWGGVQSVTQRHASCTAAWLIVLGRSCSTWHVTWPSLRVLSLTDNCQAELSLSRSDDIQPVMIFWLSFGDHLLGYWHVPGKLWRLSPDRLLTCFSLSLYSFTVPISCTFTGCRKCYLNVLHTDWAGKRVYSHVYRCTLHPCNVQ